MPGCLYLLTFPGGRRYVGCTIRTMKARWAQHCRDAEGGKGHAVQHAIRKHGAGNVQVRVLIHADDLEYLHLMERSAIQAFGTLSPGGYNMTAGGDGFRGLAEEARRARIKATLANKDQWRDRLSKAWTPEMRAARAEEIKAKWQGEYGERLRRAHQKRSAEHPKKPKPVRPRKDRAASWTPEKRAIHAAKIAAVAQERRDELAAQQRAVMAQEGRPLQLAQRLSKQAGFLYRKGKKPRRGNFVKALWDQIPEVATFEQLFELGFRSVSLTKAVNNGNLVRCHDHESESHSGAPSAGLDRDLQPLGGGHAELLRPRHPHAQLR